MDVSDALAYYQREERLTQRQIAVELGVSPAFLNDVAHRRRNLSDGRIMALPFGALRDLLIAARKYELSERTAELDGIPLA